MAAITQQRPPGVLSGRRYGSFAGKTADTGSTHPVGILTQQRPPGILSGRRYGSFAGRGANVWDFAAPTELALSGTIAISGDIAFVAGVLDLDAATFGLAGALAISGDFGYAKDIAQTAALALSGTIGLAGDIAFSDAPLPADAGGGGSVQRRKRRGFIAPSPASDAYAQWAARVLATLAAAGVFDG